MSEQAVEVLSTLVTLSVIFRDLAVAVVAGSLVMVAGVLPSGAASRRAVKVASVAAMVWAASAAVFTIATSAVIINVSPSDEAFAPQVWQFLTQISLGNSYVNGLAAALIVSVLAALIRTPAQAALALIPVVWTLAWQAQTGHAAGATYHHLASTAMFLHLAGSALWLGILVGLALVRKELGDQGADAVRRVSRIAIWAAWLIVVSGAVNAWLRLGSVADLFTTTYGQLLLAKLLLMSGAIALAAWHRKVNLPRLTNADVQSRFWRILSVDIGLLVAVIGIAGALSRQAPPIDIVPLPEPTPAFFLTGYVLPPAPELINWLTLWRLELITAFVVIAAAVTYIRWFLRLRARGDHWPVGRVVLFLAGLALATWVTQGGPAVYGMVSFSGHMVEHMLLIMAVPLPLAMAAPVTLALRAVPSRTDGSRGGREWLRVVVDSRVMRFFAHPVVAAANFALSMLLFYYSPVFEFALRNHAAHLWMLFHFVLVGYLFANALVGIDPGPKRLNYPMRIVLLFATMAFHAFFGVALTTSQVLLAPTWFGLMGRTWGPDAISDQQFGGALAWGLGEVPVVLLAIIVLVQWRRDDAREGRRKDRQATRDDDAELRAYNAMLASRAGPGARGEGARPADTPKGGAPKSDAQR